MPSPTLGLKNDFADQDTIPAVWLNTVADELDDQVTVPQSQAFMLDPGAAGADISDLAMWAAPASGCTLSGMGIVPQEVPAGIDNANTCVITIKDAAGNTMVTKTYNTGTPAPGQKTYASLGALDAIHKVLTANEVVTVTITQGATSDIGSLVFVLEWEPS